MLYPLSLRILKRIPLAVNARRNCSPRSQGRGRQPLTMAGGETVGIGHEIARRRVRLSLAAQERARILGKTAGEVMSRTCREIQLGESEYEIAGRVAGAFTPRGSTHRWFRPTPTNVCSCISTSFQQIVGCKSM